MKAQPNHMGLQTEAGLNTDVVEAAGMPRGKRLTCRQADLTVYPLFPQRWRQKQQEESISYSCRGIFQQTNKIFVFFLANPSQIAITIKCAPKGTKFSTIFDIYHHIYLEKVTFTCMRTIL